jgi:diguanylate cyclase (GGDEF)-like protein
MAVGISTEIDHLPAGTSCNTGQSTPIENEGLRVAERLRTGVADMAIDVGGKALRITVSVGLTRVDDDGDLRASIRKADIALYRAKALGHNLVCGTSVDETVPAV